MREAVTSFSDQMIEELTAKLSHPIVGPVNLLFGTYFGMGSTCATIKENARHIRARVMQYVQDRKSGARPSKMDNADIMSQLTEHQDVFSDEIVVSTLLAFIFAAIETT